jgi:hypothetical protein
LKSVFDDDEQTVSLVGPPKSLNIDEAINDNGFFVSSLCGRAELDLWFLSGRVFNQDWTFWSTKGCSNCDNWIGTSAFLTARKASKTFTPDSDHKVLTMTFDVICAGVRLDEAAYLKNLIREPARMMKVDIILKIVEDPHFDTFLSGDERFMAASAKLAKVVHHGATRREGLIAMDEWMEAVENTALVVWKSQGKNGHKKLPPRRPLPLSNDLRWRFNVLVRRWRKEFGGS